LTWGAWIGSIGLCATPLAVLQAQAPPATTSGTPTSETRTVRPRSALETAIDYHLKGEYDTAEAIFAEAGKYQQYLTADDKAKLADYRKRNQEAMTGRRAALDQLLKADQLVAAGKTSDAEPLMKALRTSKYLNAQERQQVALMDQQLKAKSSKRKGVMEWMSRDAKDSKETSEKPDTEAMVTEARRALERGDVDQAESLAKQAEQMGHRSLFPWSDTPSKVMKDAQASRMKAMPKVADAPPAKPSMLGGIKSALPIGDSGEKKIVRVDSATPPKPATPSASMSPLMPPSTPPAVKPAAAPAITRVPLAEATPTAKMQPADVKALVKQARQALDRNDYATAESMARQARVQTGVKYGLFEDTPDKVLADALKARDSGKDDKAGTLLAEARRKMEAGEYDEAEKLTYQAEGMKPSYPIWHRGERHDKLRQEIVAKRKSSSKTPLPPLLDPVALRQQNVTKPSGFAAASPGGKPTGPAVVDARKQDAVQMIGEARAALNRGDYPSALNFAAQAKSTGASFSETEDSPEAILAAVRAVQASARERQPIVADAAKKQAMQCVADARLMQKEGRLIEAFQCAQQGKKLGAVFAPNEDSPEGVLNDLRVGCQMQVDTYSKAARTLVERGQFQDAERYWRYVFQLAQCYGMETTAFGDEIVKVQQMYAGKASTATGEALSQGEEIAAQAEKELARGDLIKARNFANALYTGPYNMKDKARDLLAQVDDAEHKALVKRTKLAYEQGVRAYGRKEYAVAMGFFQSIDLRLLEADKRAHAQEILSSREMQANADVRVAKADETPDQPNAGKTTVSDNPPKPIEQAKPSLADKVRESQKLELQRLRQEALASQQQANKLAGAGDLEGAAATLQTAVAAVKNAGLDPEQVAPLLKQLEARHKQYSIMREQVAFTQTQQSVMRGRFEGKQKEFLLEESKKEQVSELMKKYANLIKEGKYDEAYMAAAKAHELDPDSAATDAALFRANILRNQSEERTLLDRQRAGVSQALRDQVRASTPDVSDTRPVAYSSDFQEMTGRRKSKLYNQINKLTPQDREVQNKLNTIISVDFKNKPLNEVLNELRSLSNVNIVPDQPFIEADNISLEQPVTIQLNSLPLSQVLNRLLHNAKLTYAVRDGVLLVTTPAGRRGNDVKMLYPVADLVSAIDRFTPPDANQITNTGLKSVTEAMGAGASNLQVKYMGGTMGGPEAYLAERTTQSQPSQPSKAHRRPGQSMEDILIQLIKNTIDPASWTDLGGSGTIEYYPLGMSLVVNQTPDIQEQIQQLLQRLRELQDLQVTVEVRFITLTEEFYEKIGIDFDIEIDDDQTRFDSMVANNNFAPPGHLNEPDHLDNVIVGLTPTGDFTSDLDIPINSSSFNLANPPFGGFPNSPGANGGLDLGIAFLSSIEVYMFMEAAQGDRRSNVLTAPKITLFNGQTANINSSTQQFFVTQVIPITNPFTGFTTFLPINTPFPTQVDLTVQAVVTADRRYVQLTLNPLITRTRVGGTFQPVPGITLQQPTIDILSVGTTVSVPDGGTILMGGLKNMSEGRNEFGPPVLSKIPYINRLFRNIGYGRESTSLMIMVTPRIIIPEEEEERLGNTFAF
jgi:type II secretory pathway component GspD/PulD (secretin)